MDEQMNMQAPASGSKTWLWVAAAAAVLAVAGWMWWATPAAAPVSETGLSETDTTAELDAELQATDLGDLDAELEAMNADLNAL